ncbi:hypothetical protein H4S02_001888 [Coemansia sp. RSA 2611]|nr:hypothetical protein IWW51_000974 [Coemansia sp. RSA 2702]KAJ2390385.1 hypothetical protein H4S02_001888 [Coemansia sp. RSA 2611]
MRACFSSLALAALAGIQVASAAPVAADGAQLVARDDAVGVQYVPASVDWNKVDWSQVNWSVVNWGAVNWQSVFSSSTAYTTVQAQPSPSPAPAPLPAPVQSSAAPVYSSAAPTHSSPAPAPSLSPQPAPSPQPSPTPVSSPAPAPSPEPETSSSIAAQPDKPSYSSGSLWGLTYSPYNNDGSCPDIGTVSAQLQKVAGVTSNIRLYSTDCSQLRNALQAISTGNIGINIHAGIWISDGASRMQSDLDEFVAAVKQYGSGLVKGVSVGNEDISKGMSESTLIGYINQVRARLQAEGLGNIPVYATEQDAHFTQAIAAVCDLVQVNIYSIFDSIFTSVDSSVQSVIQRADNIKNNVAGGKPVRFGETGWSSSGSTGPSPLSLLNEIAYVQKFKCAAAKAGYDYFYFEAKDALWKNGAAASEQNFGIFNSDYVQKFDLGLLNLLC